MTTFLDEGLIEECLSSPDSLLDYDDCHIIDLDDIDAIIEDPGYILEEPVEVEMKPEKFVSSYGKRSFTLPVRFFDITRNVKLLSTCRPVSVNIVDCRIYPWYYRKIKRDVIDEESNIILNRSNDDKVISPDQSSSHNTHLADSFNAPKIGLSSEQSQVISKLKHDIEIISNAQKTCENVNIDCDSKETQSYANKDEEKNNRGENIEDADLIKYKAIAESIVRNIDKENFNLEKSDGLVKKIEVNKSKSADSNCYKPVDVEKAIRVTTINKHDILSQKTHTKIKAPNKKIGNKRNLKNCGNLGQCCNRSTSQSSKFIPHTHYRPATPCYTALNNFYYINMNRFMSQYYSTPTYLKQNKTNKLYPPVSHLNYFAGNNQSNFVIKRTRYSTPSQSSQSQFPINFRPPSWYKHNNPVYNLQEDRIYNHVSSMNNLPSQVTTNCEKRGGVSKNHISTVNYRVKSGDQSCNSFIVPHSKVSRLMDEPSNPYVNPSRLQIPLQTTVSNVNKNPVLNQLLNKPIVPPDIHLLKKRFSEPNNVTYPNVLQHTSSVIGNDNNNTYSNLHFRRSPYNFNNNERHAGMCGPSTLQSVDSSNVDILSKNVENAIKKASEAKPPSPNKEVVTELEGICDLPCKTKPIPIPNSQMNYNSTSNVTNDTDARNSVVTTSRQNVGENITELSELSNLVKHLYRSNIKVNDAKIITRLTATEQSSTTNGYSPPILPIPTFENSLQMLSEPLERKVKNTTTNESSIHKNNLPNNIYGKSNIIRKRQHKNDTNTQGKSKKISLQEYKQRIVGAERIESKIGEREIVPAESLKSGDITVQHEGYVNVDTTDLGYDSDCNIVFDLFN